MKIVTYDRATGQVDLSDGQRQGGIKGFMSFNRLIRHLEAHGECGPNERITHIEVSAAGIEYLVEFKK